MPQICLKSQYNKNAKKRHFAFITAGIFSVVEYIKSLWAEVKDTL